MPQQFAFSPVWPKENPIFPLEVPQVGQKIRVSESNGLFIVEATVASRTVYPSTNRELFWITLSGVDETLKRRLKDICFISGHPAWTGELDGKVSFLKVDIID